MIGRRTWRLAAAAVVLVPAAVAAGCGGPDRSASLADTAPVALATRAVAATLDRNGSTQARLHDTVSARVTAYAGTVHVKAVDVPPGWRLDPALTLPVAVRPGTPLTITVRLTGTGARGPRDGALVVHTDLRGTQSALTLSLGGFEQVDAGGSNEPSLPAIAAVFGWTPPASGADLDVRYFKPLNAAEPVTVTVLGAWVRTGTAAPVAWRAQAAAESDHTVLLTLAPSDTQTLLPLTVGGGPAVASFRPGGPFALLVDGQDSDDARDVPRADCKTFCTNRFEAFPVVRGGTAVPGAYVVGVDYYTPVVGSGVAANGEQANGDYQDSVLLVQNVVPTS